MINRIRAVLILTALVLGLSIAPVQASPVEVNVLPTIMNAHLQARSLTNMMYCNGQVETITVSGNVQDQFSHPVYGATVSLNNGPGCSYSVGTNPFGNYAVVYVFHDGYVVAVHSRGCTGPNPAFYTIMEDRVINFSINCEG